MASFGEKLRLEREMRGVSLREMADATKISVRFLRAIEEDRVDILPGGLFPRAFVKQYASFLALDGDKLSAEWAAAHGQAVSERRPVPGRSGPIEERPRVTPLHVVLGVAALVVVAFALRRSGPQERRQAEPAKPIVAAPAVLPTDRVYPLPNRKPASAAGQGLLIALKADQECWVEVRADGETRVNKVLAQGESLVFEARGEIVLSLGNAGGVQVRLNDRPALPLGKNGEVRKNIVITHQNLPSLLLQEQAAPVAGGRG